MSKKLKVAADMESLRAALSSFDRQRDRGTALIAAAWVDDSLERYLRSVLTCQTALVNDLLRSDGPLGSLSARAKLARTLGLIEPAMYRDIEIIRKVRNRFAHAREHLAFSHPDVRDMCRHFHAIRAFSLGSVPVKSPRARFSMAAYFVSAYVLAMSDRPELGRKFEGDIYGEWVRRLSKTLSLRLIRKTLDQADARRGA